VHASLPHPDALGSRPARPGGAHTLRAVPSGAARTHALALRRIPECAAVACRRLRVLHGCALTTVPGTVSPCWPVAQPQRQLRLQLAAPPSLASFVHSSWQRSRSGSELDACGTRAE
jgi:hypothetical protein